MTNRAGLPATEEKDPLVLRHVPSLDISRSTRSRNEMHVEQDNRLGKPSFGFAVNLGIAIQWVCGLSNFDSNGWGRAFLSSRVKP
jgi:hypothetical protein